MRILVTLALCALPLCAQKVHLDTQTTGNNFYWDNTNKRLALGWSGSFGSVVGRKLEIKDAGPWASNGIYDTLRVAVGNYPSTGEYGGGAFRMVAPIAALVDLPSGTAAGTRGFAVTGYARSNVTGTDPAGGGFFGSVTGSGVATWGVNAGASDCIAPGDCSQTFAHATLRGAEFNVDARNALAVVGIGVDIVGGSEFKPTDYSYAVRVRPLGINESPKITWDYALYSERGAADAGVFLDASAEGDNVSSQAIILRSYNAAGASRTSNIISDPDGNLNLLSGTTGALVVVGDGTSTAAVMSPNGLVTPVHWQVQAQSIVLANGDNDNINISVFGNFTVSGPSGAFAVTGFTGGANGRILYIWNASGQQMTIKNEDAGSTAAMRIQTNTGADVVLRNGNSAATFIYNSTASRWILVSSN